jgi:xanthine/uracil permease
MFEGEKTSIFYTGLFILGGSLFSLFLTLWIILIDATSYAWKIVTPFVFGSAVFLVIGYYLMKIGVKREPPQTS